MLPDPDTKLPNDAYLKIGGMPGAYRVALSHAGNIGGPTLSDPFRFSSATQSQSFCGEGVFAPFCDESRTKRSEGAGAVPEPSTWAMMIVGFGAVGGLLRRRRASRTAAHA